MSDNPTNTATTSSADQAKSLSDRRHDLSIGYQNLSNYIRYPEFRLRLLAVLDVKRVVLEEDEKEFAATQPPKPEPPDAWKSTAYDTGEKYDYWLDHDPGDD